MKKYEHRIVATDSPMCETYADPESHAWSEVTKAGQDGWALVAVVPRGDGNIRFYLSREVPR